jgi:hypothetical protein
MWERDSRETRGVTESASSTATLVLLKPTFNSKPAQCRRKIPYSILVLDMVS